MDSATIMRRGERVVLACAARRLAIAFSYRAALDVARSIMWKARDIIPHEADTIFPVRIRRIDQDILVEDARSGNALFILPIEAAHRVGEAMISKARDIESEDISDELAFDQGILLRKGVPLGLTSNPRIQDEAAKIAAWDGRLRRYIRGGVRRLNHVGTPGIKKEKREKM